MVTSSQWYVRKLLSSNKQIRNNPSTFPYTFRKVKNSHVSYYYTCTFVSDKNVLHMDGAYIYGRSLIALLVLVSLAKTSLDFTFHSLIFCFAVGRGEQIHYAGKEERAMKWGGNITLTTDTKQLQAKYYRQWKMDTTICIKCFLVLWPKDLYWFQKILYWFSFIKKLFFELLYQLCCRWFCIN